MLRISSADLNAFAAGSSRSSQYTGIDEGTPPPRLMFRRSRPSIWAVVRASTIFTSVRPMEAATSEAVAT